MRKLLFLLTAFFLLGGVRMSASKIYATMGTPAANGEWDSGTNTYTWSHGANNLMQIFDCSSIPLEEYTSLHLTATGYTSAYRVCFMQNTKALATITFMSDGDKNIVFSDRDELSGVDLSKVTHLSFGGASYPEEGSSASITITDVYLVKPTTLSFDEDGVAYIYPDDFVLTGGLTMDDENKGKMTRTGGGTLTVSLGDVDFSNVYSITVNYNRSEEEGYTDLFNSTAINDVNGSTVGAWYYSRYGINYTDKQSISAHVSSIVMATDKDGTMEINSICIKKNVIKATLPAIDLKDDMFKCWTAADATGKPTNSTTLLLYSNLKTEQKDGATIWGNPFVNYLQYADLSEYGKLIIRGTPGRTLRVLFNRLVNDGAPTEVQPTLDASGKAVVDLTGYSYVHLNAIKLLWGAPETTITSLQLVKKGNYCISGNGDLNAAAAEAFADENAVYIDATAMTGTGNTLTSANPNCIFKANSGVLTNENNVMVDGTIAKLSLTDGYDFAVPAEAKVTAATYTRSTVANKFGTVCLPYEVTIPVDGSVKFYGIKGINAANALVLEEKSGTLPAGTPAILYSGNDVTSISLSNSDEYLLVSSNTAVDKLTLVGSYEAKSIDAASDASKSYYGISNNQFVRATNTLNVKPFRAYITAEKLGLSEANVLRLLIGDDDVTGNMEQTQAAPTVEAIYNLQGVRLSTMQKGMNILQMSNGQSVKVLVK